MLGQWTRLTGYYYYLWLVFLVIGTTDGSTGHIYQLL